MLTVQTLGQLALWREGQRLPETIWKRAKARALFLYLVTHAGHFVARDRISSDLWPSLDPDRAERDFKVALTTLQSALQPDRAARRRLPPIASQGGSYGINPAFPMALDYVAFERQVVQASRLEASDAAAAVAAYQEALARVRGTYLPEAVYADWTAATRERLTTLFLTAAMRLAQLLHGRGQPVEAVYWCERVLAVDPCWEDAYRLLMAGYAAQGNRPMVKKTFAQCRRRLQAELGLEPMPETVRLYEQMVPS